MVVGEVTSRSFWPKQDNYMVVFDGTPIDVTVTSTPSVVRKWLKAVHFKYRRHRHHLVVGLGVQWTPAFYRPDPPAEVLQLCVGRRCLIVQLVHCDFITRLLRRFLLDPNNTFVGIWNPQDESKLWSTRHRLRVEKLLDLRYLETEDGESLRGASFERIVDKCLGIKGCGLNPDISQSDWDDEDLSEAQVVLACVKAHVAFLIGRNIKAWELS